MQSFFNNAFKVSNVRITRAPRSKSIVDTLALDRRGKHIPSNKTLKEKMNEVKQFINHFPSYQSNYSRVKNPELKYILYYYYHCY